MKVALVCDWLTNAGGAERVLKAFHELYPDAPIYTSQYNPKGIDWFKDADVRTGWLQKFPSSLRRFLAPLRQKYFSQLDLSDYDLVISVTGAEAKSIITENKEKGTKALHLCYCHVPTQYYYQLYDQYLKNPGFGLLNPLARLALKVMVKPLRQADRAAAKRPDYFITISRYAADQITKYYKRKSVIVHPPVAVENFADVEADQASSYFINYSRQVSWKRLDLAIKACLRTNQRLLLIGDGPEHQRLKKLAQGSDLIKFLPNQSQKQLKKYLSGASAFIFPSIEPFGIAPVEALAAGVPVLAYNKGGALDYIKDGENGLFFSGQSTDSLSITIEKFYQLQKNTTTFNSKKIKSSVQEFSEAQFKQKIQDFVHAKMA